MKGRFVMPTRSRHFATCRLHLCALAGCAALFATPALAAFGSFSFPPSAVVQGGGSFGPGATALPNVGAPTILFNFVLPRDYDRDAPVRIVLYLTAESVAGTCGARIIPSLLVRMREGRPLVNGLGGLAGGALVTFAGGDVVEKVFTLNPGGAMPGQRPGDAIEVQFRREAFDASDTCPDDIIVRAIDIRYTLRP
jgi:hypothetical protein